ncbi:MAG: ATP-binding cassette domain-containing protein [Defluviitaleaceae bacterium]|nr:ATP-binding cassette domain-containing protein [Defluviitaleaceae bacterium]
MAHSKHINIIGAKENNLKNITLSLPKYNIIVVTGVSGSGKSSLVLDTIAAQSRRELNDTFPSFAAQYLPKYGRPNVEKIENLPVAIIIDRKKPAQNSRSTVGTYNDIYSPLRLLFSRIGKPFVGFSNSFSFNHPLGRCPRCDGLGTIDELDIHKLVDFNKSLNDEGVIKYAAFEPGLWRWKRYAFSGLFDLDKKIKDYSKEEIELFLHSPQIKLKNPPSNWPKSAKFEGLVNRMYRSVIHSDEGKLHRKLLDPMLNSGVCPECNGKRLNKNALSCLINGKNISDITDMPLLKLLNWLNEIADPIAVDIKTLLSQRVSALCDIGLSYLTLSRGIGTLSGGEASRCKIAKHINSPLSDVLYVLDEPSVGLHSHDIKLLKASIKKLADNGNTIMLVEHNEEMIKTAGHIVDMGPGSGESGGEVLFQGSYGNLIKSETITSKMLNENTPFRKEVRRPNSWFLLENANTHNLKDLTVNLPLGVLTVIAGVAGSGKSSLMSYFCEKYPKEVVYISQKSIGISLRSTPATYLEAADDIRKLYAKECKQSTALFSFNGKGACPVCDGKGIIVSEMVFMDSIETVCEACNGLRYSDEALQHKVDGRDISQTMDLTIDDACAIFEDGAISAKLRPAMDVGLGYLRLNRSLSTLSGGELQRLKLASYLNSKGEVFVIDEPTDGLHLKDIRMIIKLFDQMVDAGNSVFLIEHNLAVLKSADYAIELGPGGGEAGGNVLFEGKSSDILDCAGSVTAKYLLS